MTSHRIGVLSFVIALGLTSTAHARRVEISGPVEVIQVDDFDHGRSRLIHRVRDDRTGRRRGAARGARRVPGRVVREYPSPILPVGTKMDENGLRV